MAISFVNAGAEGAAASGNVTLGAPASPANDDIWIAVVHSRDQVSHTFTDWTQIAQFNGGGTTSRLSVWYFRYAGSNPNLTVSHSAGDCIIGGIAAFRGCISSGSPVQNQGSTSGSTGTQTGTDMTPSADDCMVLFCTGRADDDSYSAITNWTVAFEDSAGGTQNNYGSSLGGDGSVAVYYRLQTTATATGTLTATTAATDAWASVIIALKPPPATQALTPSLFENSATFHAATITTGPVGLTASLFENAATFHAPTVLSTYALTAELFSDDVRTNLIRRSQELNVAPPWGDPTGLIVTADATTAPDGTTTAEKLTENSSADVTHRLIGDNIGVVSGQQYTYSIYAKAAEKDFFLLFDGDLNGGYHFQLSGAGSSTIYAGTVSATITNVGGGWYRCSITYAAPGANLQPRIHLTETYAGNIQYSGDGASGVYFWGAQLEAGSILTSYIPTTSAAVTVAGDTFYAPTVTSVYALIASLFENTPTFHAPTVENTGPQDVQPSLFTNSPTFHAPTVSASYGVTPALFENSAAFHAPTVSATYGLTAGLFVDDDTFYGATVGAGGGTQDLQPALFVSSPTFHAPTVSATYALAAELYVDDDTFYGAIVSGSGDQALFPELFVNISTIYPPGVTLRSPVVNLRKPPAALLKDRGWPFKRGVWPFGH